MRAAGPYNTGGPPTAQVDTTTETSMMSSSPFSPAPVAGRASITDLVPYGVAGRDPAQALVGPPAPGTVEPYGAIALPGSYPVPHSQALYQESMEVDQSENFQDLYSSG